MSSPDGDDPQRLSAALISDGATHWIGTDPCIATPIPGVIWLLGSGLLGLVGVRRKFRK